MKVTLYIDGEHNTVEVKDKIRSFLPDARYMIFHPAENKGKVTEFDRIKNMNVQELAEFINEVSCGGCVVTTDCITGSCTECLKIWLETEVEE